MTAHSLKVAYLSGPADVLSILEEWQSNEPGKFFGSNYMRQFFQLMHDRKFESLTISWFQQKRFSCRVGGFSFLNAPLPNFKGFFYHLSMFAWMLAILPRIIRFKPDVIILTGNQNYWWVLWPLHILRTQFILSYHSALWPQNSKVRTSWKILLWLNGTLIVKSATAIVVASDVTKRQIAGSISAESHVTVHLPTYSVAQFVGIDKADPCPNGPFRILFVGRMVRNKGIFDVFEIAARLSRERPNEFVFDFCGDGEDLHLLTTMIDRDNLGSVIKLHGQCTPDQLRIFISQSHVFIVPTRSDIEAGFEMTCAEAILSCRPLITSRNCPAIEYVRPGTVEVAPDDVEGYYTAIKSLRDDPALYAAKRDATLLLRDQFFDASKSWYAAINNALEKAAHRRLEGVVRNR